MSPRDPNTAPRGLPRTEGRRQIAALLALLLLLGVSCGHDPQRTASQSMSVLPPPTQATEYPPVPATAAPSPQADTTQTRATSPLRRRKAAPPRAPQALPCPTPGKTPDWSRTATPSWKFGIPCSEALIWIAKPSSTSANSSAGKPGTCPASSSDWCGGSPEDHH